MGRIDKIRQCSKEFTQSQITRLNGEASFANSFPNSTDILRQGVIDKIMTGGFLSAPTPLIGLTTQLEQANLISTAAAAASFVSDQSDLVSSAVDAMLDTTLTTGVSNALGTSLADFVKKQIPDSQDTEILQFANRQFGDVSTRNQSVIFASVGAIAEQVDRGLYDDVKKGFTKTFSIAGMAITADPAGIFGIADVAINTLSDSSSVLSDEASQIIQLTGEIVVLCAEFADPFYDEDKLEVIRQSRAFLVEADSQLVNVRSQMINQGIFSEGLFASAKANVDSSETALGLDIEVEPKISEINSKLDLLENLLSEIEDVSVDINGIKANLEGMVDFFDANANIFGSLFAGQVHNIQNEIRSIIESMDAALIRRRNIAITQSIALWRAQLLLILQTMCALPQEIDAYFDEDPDDLKLNFDALADALLVIPNFGLEILVAQGKAFVSIVRKKLGSRVVLDTVEALGSILSGEAAAVQVIAGQIQGAIDNYIPPGTAARKLADNVIASFESSGMDRATAILKNGDFVKFFAVTPLTATFTGALLQEVNDLIDCIESDIVSPVDRTGLEAMKTVQNIIFNIKRNEDLLASTFAQFRDQAIEQISRVEIPIIQGIDSLIARAANQLAGGLCDC